MSTTSRRKSAPIVTQLTEQPYNYQFTQAVRLLERSAVLDTRGGTPFAKNPIAQHTPPTSESIRFESNQSLSFAPADISTLKQEKNTAGNQQWKMAVNFMGLTGSKGVLPYHYTEQVHKQLKTKDKALSGFFNLFNHRIVSLFYQASVKYRLPMSFERSQLNKKPHSNKDPHTQALLAIMGLCTKHLSGQLYSNDQALIQYAGLFSQKVRSVTGLKQLLSRHFSIPVEIRQFVAQQQPLIDDVRTHLPTRFKPKGQNCQLGKNMILGKSGRFAQGKVCIVLGPLNHQQFKKFQPGSSTLKALNELVQLYTEVNCDYDFVLRISKRDMESRMTLDKIKPPRLGWSSWLSSKSNLHFYRDEMLDIHVTANHFL